MQGPNKKLQGWEIDQISWNLTQMGNEWTESTSSSPVWNLDQWKALISAIQKPVNHKTFSEKSLEKVSPIKYISQGLFRA